MQLLVATEAWRMQWRYSWPTFAVYWTPCPVQNVDRLLKSGHSYPSMDLGDGRTHFPSWVSLQRFSLLLHLDYKCSAEARPDPLMILPFSAVARVCNCNPWASSTSKWDIENAGVENAGADCSQYRKLVVFRIDHVDCHYVPSFIALPAVCAFLRKYIFQSGIWRNSYAAGVEKLPWKTCTAV